MSFTTYAELQTEIADWSHRSDLATKIPTFIRLAESGFNSILQARVQEVDTELTATIGSRYIALPADFYEHRFLWITEYEPRDEVIYKSPEQLVVGTSTTVGSPEHFTIDGTNIAFDYVADKAYTFTLRYTQAFGLSDSVTTNWLLLNHPDLYLNASMVQLAIYTQDMQMLQVWKPMYEQVLKDVFNKEARIKGHGKLEVDMGLLDYGGRGWNINNGSYN